MSVTPTTRRPPARFLDTLAPYPGWQSDDYSVTRLDPPGVHARTAETSDLDSGWNIQRPGTSPRTKRENVLSGPRTRDRVRSSLRVYSDSLRTAVHSRGPVARPVLGSPGRGVSRAQPSPDFSPRECLPRTRRCTSLMHSSTRVDDRPDPPRARTIQGPPHGVPTRCCPTFLVCGTVPLAAASRGATL